MIPYISPKSKIPLKNDGVALISELGETFPLLNGIARFVPRNNYADAFGLQWKTHAKVQLDSFNGTKISHERLERCLGFRVEELRGKTVLEVGCGAGRFTEILVTSGALVHSVDLSEAVEANKANIGEKENYTVAQADVYNLPFPIESFDLVICLGVIQHTPNPELTFQALWAMVKSGGLMVVDHYTYDWMYILKPLFIFRFFLRRMKPQRSKKIVDNLVKFFFPSQWKYKNNPFMRMLLNRFSPCYTYFNTFPQLNKEQHYELTRLDTYDGLTDYYKHLITLGRMKNVLESLHPLKYELWKGGNGIEARAWKK